MPAPIFGPLAAGRKLLIGVFVCLYVVSIVANIRNTGLYILDIGLVGQKSNSRYLALVVYINLGYTVFIFQKIFNALLALIALNGGCIDLNSNGFLLLGRGRQDKACHKQGE